MYIIRGFALTREMSLLPALQFLQRPQTYRPSFDLHLSRIFQSIPAKPCSWQKIIPQNNCVGLAGNIIFGGNCEFLYVSLVVQNNKAYLLCEKCGQEAQAQARAQTRRLNCVLLWGALLFTRPCWTCPHVFKGKSKKRFFTYLYMYSITDSFIQQMFTRCLPCADARLRVKNTKEFMC